MVATSLKECIMKLHYYFASADVLYLKIIRGKKFEKAQLLNVQLSKWDSCTCEGVSIQFFRGHTDIFQLS